MKQFFKELGILIVIALALAIAYILIVLAVQFMLLPNG
jgi:hypothetical protein